jgi:type IV fimbrial biogenesis protein FimT
MSRPEGFTLLELAIVLTMAGILLVASGPAIGDLFLDMRRTRILNELVRALHLARTESLRTGAEISVCGSEDLDGCAGDGLSWSAGWIVIDESTPSPRILLRKSADTPARIGGNRHTFTYRPNVRRSTNGTLVYCDRRGTEEARAVIVSHTGRPRVSASTASGQPLSCPG